MRSPTAASAGAWIACGPRTASGNPSRKLVCSAHEPIGRIYLVKGEHEADQELERAIEIADAIEHPPVAWRARSLRAELASRRGQRAVAERERAIAGRLFERLTPGIPESALRSEFQQLGERTLSDPLGAHR